jgi:hypothetical protein
LLVGLFRYLSGPQIDDAVRLLMMLRLLLMMMMSSTWWKYGEHAWWLLFSGI